MNLAHEDDGIIDLRALKSTPPPRGAFAAVGAFPIGSPFASEPPPAAFAFDAGAAGARVVDGVPSRASRAKTFGIAAGAALFLVLGAVGVGYAFRGETAVKVASASPAQVAPPPVVVAPASQAVADPAPAAAAAAPASANDETSTGDAPSADAKKKKGAKARAGAVKAKASTAAASPASKPAATKSADPCHCHGDFQCNIRCSANR